MESNGETHRIRILMAGDEPDDRTLPRDALDEVRLANEPYRFENVELPGRQG